MRYNAPYPPNRPQNLLPAALGLAAALIFATEAARSETPGPTSGAASQFTHSDAACQVCEALYERCGPQLHLGLCIESYVQCLKDNYCEVDPAPGPNGLSTAPSDMVLQSQTATD